MRWCLIDFGRISYSLLPSWFLQDFPGKSYSTHILISFLWLNHVEGNVNNPITLIIISFFSIVCSPKIDQRQADWSVETPSFTLLYWFLKLWWFYKMSSWPQLVSRVEYFFYSDEKLQHFVSYPLCLTIQENAVSFSCCLLYSLKTFCRFIFLGWTFCLTDFLFEVNPNDQQQIMLIIWRAAALNCLSSVMMLIWSCNLRAQTWPEKMKVEYRVKLE